MQEPLPSLEAIPLFRSLNISNVDRNNPKRSSASESRYSLMLVIQQFPNDAAHLEFPVEKRYPDGIHCRKCEKVTKHHEEKNPLLTLANTAVAMNICWLEHLRSFADVLKAMVSRGGARSQPLAWHLAQATKARAWHHV